MSDKVTVSRAFSLALVQSARDWRRLAGSAMAGDGVSEACAAPLLWVARLGGGVRQVDLADRVGIESASLVRVLDQLCASELVTRRADPTDRRANCVCLTAKGSAAVEAIESKLNALRERVFGEFNEADIKAALRVLNAVEVAAGRGRGQAQAR